jgi:hypothetical protein
MSRKCGSLDVSQHDEPPGPLTESFFYQCERTIVWDIEGKRGEENEKEVIKGKAMEERWERRWKRD